jgi:hypothetical protein
MPADVNYSTYTLQELLRARRCFNAACHPNRERLLEEQIQKRCAHLREPTKGKGFAARASGKRYRLYGVMAGIFFLLVSSGPFTAVEFLDAMNVITDVNGDNALLSGVWAVLTLPFAVMTFMIGGIIDAERVVRWLNL